MMSELPLTLFTTLGSVSAGAFIALALAFATTTFSDEQLKKIDKMTALPVVMLILAFICAFFHLASPLKAFGVFAGLGTSPLSNEVLVAVIFAVVALVYWILALTGKLSEGARKACSLIVAVLAVLFAAFMGMAYMVETLISWNTVMVPLQMIGFCLMGGAALGLLVLSLAGVLDAAVEGSFKSAVLAVLVIGLIMAVGGLAAQMASVNALGNALTSGADLVSAALVPAVCGIICLIAATAIDLVALKGNKSALITVAAVVALVGVFAARYAFYALQLSVGLYVA